MARVVFYSDGTLFYLKDSTYFFKINLKPGSNRQAAGAEEEILPGCNL